MKELKQGFLWTIGAFLAIITITIILSIIITISAYIGLNMNRY